MVVGGSTMSLRVQKGPAGVVLAGAILELGDFHLLRCRVFFLLEPTEELGSRWWIVLLLIDKPDEGFGSGSTTSNFLSANFVVVVLDVTL